MVTVVAALFSLLFFRLLFQEIFSSTRIIQMQQTAVMVMEAFLLSDFPAGGWGGKVIIALKAKKK